MRSPGSRSDRTGLFLDRLGADTAELEKRAANLRVQLVVDVPGPAAEISCALAATLLLRLNAYCPQLTVVTSARTVALPAMTEAGMVDALAQRHDGFTSVGRLSARRKSEPDLALVFSGDTPGVAVISSGWSVGIGRAAVAEGNPFAAAFAGVLASAEVLKLLLQPYLLTTRPRAWRGQVSLWDGSDGAGPDLRAVDLGNHAWAGAGGVASAAAWVLAAAGLGGVELAGTGHVVDDDAIDAEGTNLNRHLTASWADVCSPKAQLLVDLLAPSLQLTALIERWQESAATRAQTVLVSVDDDRTRRDVQLDLPQLVVNAGTGDDGQYRASTHRFLDGACLGCISRSDGVASSPEEGIAQRLHVDFDALLPHLNSTEPLPQELLAAVPAELRSGVESVPGRDLAVHLCAQVAVRNGPAVSAPMVAAAAGVLMATVAVREALAPRTNATVLRTSALTGPHPQWLQLPKSKRSSCPCTDPLYQESYRRRWQR